MDIKIRLSRLKDLSVYTDFIQRGFQNAYTDKNIGLTKDCFSKEVFATEDTQKYLKSLLVVNKQQKTWLVFTDNKLIGSATCIRKKQNEAELTGFYVNLKYQGKGIGKTLYKLVLELSENRDLVLDIYVHNKKTISMYKKWGWKTDKTKGKNGYFYRHWPEWPEGLKAKAMYMRLSFSDRK